MKRILFFIFLSIISIQLANAQCYADRHSTNWFDAWVSCETSLNPNTSYGVSHWILYDFGYLYTLHSSKLWNINDPNQLDNGIMDYAIDYSVDGVTWTNLGNYTLDQASGFSIYQGMEGPNFNATQARYVLITPISNHGGSCFGLSEFKVYLDDTVSIIDEEFGFGVSAFPNPFTDEIQIRIDTHYPNEPISYSLYDILGRQILKKNVEAVSETNTFSLSNSELNLSNGIYLLSIYQNDKQQTVKVIKE